MRIRQRDDRHRRKKKQQHGSSHLHQQQAKQLQAEPVYRRKPNPIRRYDTDVLSPVRAQQLHSMLRPSRECRFVDCKCLSLFFFSLFRAISRASETDRYRRSRSPAAWWLEPTLRWT